MPTLYAVFGIPACCTVELEADVVCNKEKIKAQIHFVNETSLFT